MYPSIWQVLILLLVVLLVFGTKKIRNLGSDLGGAVRDFRKGIRESDEQEQEQEQEDAADETGSGAAMDADEPNPEPKSRSSDSS